MALSRYHRIMRIFLLFVLMSLTTPVFAADMYRVDGAFIRATPAKISAGYMVITNNTDMDDALVSVTAAWAQRAELHTIEKNADGVLSMKEIASMPLPKHGELRLKNGGYHIMFFGVNKPLLENTAETITLHFKQAGDMIVNVAVKPITFKP